MIAEWHWPGQRDSFTVAAFWTSDDSADVQPDSGLVTLVAANGDTSRLRWDSATEVIQWQHGAETLTTPALDLIDGTPVGWAISYDGDIARLVVAIGDDTYTDETPSVAGTTEPNWLSMLVGVATEGFGSGDFGDGVFGGSAATDPLGGVIDNLMVFDGPVSVGEAVTLLSSSSPLGGLPSPEGRLIWYAPLDADVSPVGSLLTTGLRYQATDELGATPVVTDSGLSLGLCVLRAVAVARTPFAVHLSGTVFEVGALLATDEDEDALADQHNQFAAVSRQTLRMR